MSLSISLKLTCLINSCLKGISKGIKTIELKKRKKLDEKDKDEDKLTQSNFYAYLLALLTCIVLLMTIPIYLFDKHREKESALTQRAKLDLGQNMFIIYSLFGEELNPVLKVKLAVKLPKNLRPDTCTCDLFDDELEKFSSVKGDRANRNSNLKCIACLDWPYRNNLRVYLEQKNSSNGDISSLCYHLKWQSYDSLRTPLTDCIIVNEEQWYGLGDIQSPIWPLDGMDSEYTPLATNLTAEFLAPETVVSDLVNQINFGSVVEYSLLSTKGVHIGDIKTDFEAAIRFHNQRELGTKEICLTTSCTDKCTQSWLRDDNLHDYSIQNNILEYRICSASSTKKLAESTLKERLGILYENLKIEKKDSDIVSQVVNAGERRLVHNDTIGNMTMEDKNISVELDKMKPNQSTSRLPNPEVRNEFPPGIGLIERIIFATSPEFMPILDGQILRQYVDNIVKLDLKTSSILLIDTRWETYVGSMTLDNVAFPRQKLLFEILHNKGFKIVLTVKPYIDAAIGIGNLNQLFEAGRLYKASSVPRDAHFRIGPRTKGLVSSRGSLIRRKSLFKFENITVEFGSNESFRFPYLYKCKESSEGFCVLLDLNQARNRAWMVANIKRSSLLATDADGIQIGGSHPNRINWDDHYRKGMSLLVLDLFYREKLFVLPQWTGDLGYIQLAPRPFDWTSLKSLIGSVINVNSLGYSLVHPGSVWGDIKTMKSVQSDESRIANRISNIYAGLQPEEKSQEELAIRWLQVAVFFPILQFNNIAPIQRFGLNELLQNLIKVRRQSLVPEMKKNLPLCPLVSQNKTQASAVLLPLIRPVLVNLGDHHEALAPDQFSVGADIIVAPILSLEQRQRDIYLPVGVWRDELRSTSVRGGKWLRNYSVDLLEIAWFFREKR